MSVNTLSRQGGQTVYGDETELADSDFKMKMGFQRAYFRGAGIIIKILVTIEGKVDPERVRKALPILKKRHFLLGSKVILDREGQAWYVTERVPDFELQVYEKRSDLDWLERISEQDLTPFRMNVGPLARFILLTSESSSDLVLYMHHVISDGLSGVYVMEDLLSLVGEPEKELPPLPPPVDVADSIPSNIDRPWIERFFISRMNASWRKNTIAFSDDDFVELQEKRYEERDRAILLDLTAEETSELSEKCRTIGVTVNSVFLTALLAAKCAVPELTGAVKNKISFTVNLREKFMRDPGRGCGFYAGMISMQTRFNHRKDFKCNLLTLHSEVERKLPDDRELFKYMIRAGAIDARLLDSFDFELYKNHENPATKKFVALAKRVFYSVLVTNLGKQDFPERFGDLTVKKVIFLAPARGMLNVVITSVLTACGCLHAAFPYRESDIPTIVMKRYVNAVEASLRDFIAADSPAQEERSNRNSSPT